MISSISGTPEGDESSREFASASSEPCRKTIEKAFDQGFDCLASISQPILAQFRHVRVNLSFWKKHLLGNRLPKEIGVAQDGFFSVRTAVAG